MHETRYMCISQPKSVYALLLTHQHQYQQQQQQQQPVKEVTERACLNQMDKVINDYLYINEIMSFRAIQHLFIYTYTTHIHPLWIIRCLFFCLCWYIAAARFV